MGALGDLLAGLGIPSRFGDLLAFVAGAATEVYRQLEASS